MNPDLFYAYIYYDPSRNNEPIYVGKGKLTRAWSHLKSNKKSPFIQRLQKMIRNNISPVIGIYAGLEEELAHLLEMELISKFGRKDLGSGTLLNLTDGGEGMAGFIFLPSSKKKMSAAKKGKPNGRKGTFKHSTTTKSNLSQNLKGRKFSVGWLAKQKARAHPADTKSKMAKSQEIRWNERKSNNIPNPEKSFNRIQGPDRIYEDVHEAAECNNALISAIYRWCDPKTPVKSRPGWSIIKEG